MSAFGIGFLIFFIVVVALNDAKYIRDKRRLESSCPDKCEARRQTTAEVIHLDEYKKRDKRPHRIQRVGEINPTTPAA